ncbi:MAG: hypothetical protein HGA38_02805 [Candidatus Moranbacteria bacterium]|nr:hypothetical protein [Candidatus Moranbacteria bacterium]NTW46238.1 hypothetical protein [Candidatus Moranbacteria bacterium]
MDRTNEIPLFLRTEYDQADVTFRFIFNRHSIDILRFTSWMESFTRIEELERSLNSKRPIGINGCLIPDSQFTYRYELPCLYRDPYECRTCGGAGYRFGCVCANCRGTGTQREDDPNARQSFDDFCRTLRFTTELFESAITLHEIAGRETTESFQQTERQTMLYFFDDETGYDSAMRGWLEKTIVDSASSFTEPERLTVSESMRSVNARLFADRQRHEAYEFPFYSAPHFELQVPGSHSALVLDRKAGLLREGYRLNSHNVDGRSSQVMLIAGLATIDRIARERLTGR